MVSRVREIDHWALFDLHAEVQLPAFTARAFVFPVLDGLLGSLVNACAWRASEARNLRATDGALFPGTHNAG